MKYTDMTAQMLSQRINELMASAQADILEVCKIMVELERRQLSHPAMGKGIFKRFRAIAKGDLLPLAAEMFADDIIVDNLIGMPLEEQREIAMGKALPVAEATTTGEIVMRERKIEQLRLKDIPRVLSGGAIIPFRQQKAALAKTLKPKAVNRSDDFTKIKADLRKQEIVVGRVRLKVTELAGPLKELGYKLERINPVRRGRPSKEEPAHHSV